MNQLMHFSFIELLRHEESLKVLRDNYNVLQTAKEDSFAKGEAKGRAEGEAKGRAEERAQIAAKLIANGMTKEQAAAIIGIPAEKL